MEIFREPLKVPKKISIVARSCINRLKTVGRRCSTKHLILNNYNQKQRAFIRSIAITYYIIILQYITLHFIVHQIFSRVIGLDAFHN